MKTRSFLLSVVLYLLTVPVIPQGFSYQAVVRNTGGTVLSNQNVGFRFSILQGSATGTVEYSETHDLNTDSQGLVTLVIGSGSVMSGSFTGIDWSNGAHYLKVELDPTGGISYAVSETKRIQPVAYALYSGISDSISPGRVEVKGDATQNDEKALFEVKRSDGQTVFAVYPEGVRVYVKDEPGKGSKGGFAVGGFDPGKGITDEYLRVTPDSVRVYVAPGAGKGSKGGFAVGGFDPGKGLDDEYLRVTPDSVRIYIQDRETGKGSKGGFAVGGYDPAKGLTGDYFNVSGKTEAEVIHGEARVMWYPVKEAFRAGNVLIESKDSVGTNSWASGYKSKAIGDWSQALGYQAVARENFSTAIGKNSVAAKMNSFAFGEDARAKKEESYAFGRGAFAGGYRSFAFGSAGVDEFGTVTDVAMALGDYSFAVGQGSRATAKGAFSIGIADTASGDFSTAIGFRSASGGDFSTAIGLYTSAKGQSSVALGQRSMASGSASTALGGYAYAIGDYTVAIGYETRAVGFNSTAIGCKAYAEGWISTALGFETKAKGTISTATGYRTVASGDFSISMGYRTVAKSLSSLVIGQYNDTTCSATGNENWESTDPLFIIGNGTSSSRSNAITVLKNGRMGLQSVTNPTYALELPDNISPNIGSARAYGWTIYSDGRTKTGQTHIPYGLEEVMQLVPKTYIHHSTVNGNKGFEISDSGVRDIGLVAQEVYEIIPEAVTRPANEETDLWSLSYDKLVPVLVKAIQEQQSTIDHQKIRIEQLEKQASEISELKILLQNLRVSPEIMAKQE